MPAEFPVFDGHNDTLLRLVEADRKHQNFDFFDGTGGLHIDQPKARAGGFAGGLFAMFTPNPEGAGGALAGKPVMGGPITRERAEDYTRLMMDKGDALIAASDGALRLCTSAADIRSAMAEGAMAMVYHIEGAEVIDSDFAALDWLHARGLRSVGITWSRNNIFGNGVPFTFPGDPDHGEGLTDTGVELVKVCNQRGLLIDLSHLNEKGFWDVARVSSKPLVASHSNVHTLAASPRNLTDRQLDAIAESRGLVGLNFACGFLREDGQHTRRDTDLDVAIRHLDYMLERLGEDGVGIGSDFDGCTVPEAITDASGLPNLVEAMEKAGYGADLIARITHRNWINLLERTWGG
ncbi:dipeptidase [Pelagibacterium sediminicola]|uniref:dipeptidase n=1 Tax=Pelagibacterium sediminicola TaxID=2248761 RepID=UPI000E31DE62|nr:dipeptidase [Pelagibacterium sediminicola]